MSWGRGRTGSGKTLAFGLALLARVAGQRAAARQPLGLVLVMDLLRDGQFVRPEHLDAGGAHLA